MQRSGSSWGTTAGVDYSVRLGDVAAGSTNGGIDPTTTAASGGTQGAYDANGNIQLMVQRGLKLGGSVVTDSLRYQYYTGSNRLRQVTDGANDNSSTLGDFKYDPATKTDTDYSYDNNGNLITDKNKRITGIVYNHLNLPELITVAGTTNPVSNGGTIAFWYDAAGNKLRKIVSEMGRPTQVTDYVAGCVYQNDTLQQVGHAEGRARYVRQYYTNGDSAMVFANDYFLKDHLGNIRAVVTEQRDTMRYVATFETGSLAKENALFNNINTTRTTIIQGEAALGTYMEGYPNDPVTTPNHYTSLLDGVTKKLGASITLKVMAGDKVDMGVKYWYKGMGNELPDVPPTPENVLNNLLQTLGTGAAGLSGGKATPQQLSSSNSPVLPGITTFLTEQDNAAADNGTARAYLNWLLLDEQFNYVPGSSGYLRVGEGNTLQMQTLAMSGLPMSKNGYLFVYLSNGSEYTNLFFDNLIVNHHTGSLVEETQYYPFGLVQSGISSKAFGRLENTIKYNSIELERGLGLNVCDAQFRELDPQVGRWWQIDPKTDEMLMWSTYASNYDNPIRFADPLGDEPECCQGLVDFVVGVGQGLKAGAVGLKDFIVRDAWQGQTWKNLGNLALGSGLGTLSGQGTGSGLLLMDVDQKLGTNTFGTVSAVGNGLAQAGNTLLHGTAKERGNIAGQILFAVVGTKGVNAGVSAVKNAARGAKAAEAAGVVAKVSLVDEAASLIKLNGGRNSVTIETATQKIRYDLAGKAHGDVPTPHMQVYNKNFVNGVQKSVTRASKEAIPMTQKDLDLVRKFLTGQ
jgi:RHS repeat-associated protein